MALLVDADHHFASHEVAFNGLDANRKKRRMAFAERAHGARVEHEPAGGAQMIRNPLLSRVKHRRSGLQMRAYHFALGETHQHVFLPARGNDGARA